jgi:hypothetical protein
MANTLELYVSRTKFQIPIGNRNLRHPIFILELNTT